jgi:hypothetical protein
MSYIRAFLLGPLPCNQYSQSYRSKGKRSDRAVVLYCCSLHHVTFDHLLDFVYHFSVEGIAWVPISFLMSFLTVPDELKFSSSFQYPWLHCCCVFTICMHDCNGRSEFLRTHCCIIKGTVLSSIPAQHIHDVCCSHHRFLSWLISALCVFVI